MFSTLPCECNVLHTLLPVIRVTATFDVATLTATFTATSDVATFTATFTATFNVASFTATFEF